MDRELTELVFILDRSGSMSGLEEDTISGFNGLIKKQKAEGEKVNVTTVLFDDQIELIHDRFPIDVINPLTTEDYYVRGCTALLDAVGYAIKKIENIQNHLPEEHRAARVLFVITTDGHENSSKEYDYKAIKKMIEAKSEIGWDFIFLGANIDATAEAASIGINKKNAANFDNDSDGIAINYDVISEVVKGASKSRDGLTHRNFSMEEMRNRARDRRKKEKLENVN